MACVYSGSASYERGAFNHTFDDAGGGIADDYDIYIFYADDGDEYVFE